MPLLDADETVASVAALNRPANPGNAEMSD